MFYVELNRNFGSTALFVRTWSISKQNIFRFVSSKSMCQEYEETGVNNKHLNHRIYYNFAFPHTVHLRFAHNSIKMNYFLNINWHAFATEVLCFLWGRKVILKYYVLKIGLIIRFIQKNKFKLVKHNSTKTNEDIVEQNCPSNSNGG